MNQDGACKTQESGFDRRHGASTSDFRPSDSRVSIGGLVERWYYVIEGWSNPRALDGP
jgi:hypothetical protein